MKQEDTIAAIATGLSPSGIGIVRVSGRDAFRKISTIFKGASGQTKDLASMESHSVHYGYICDRDIIIDEVLLVLMKAPKSYTTEDTVEINCHGGPFVLKRVLDVVLSTGIRAAEPGEFTERAFLNGRIDLSEAQAVMDLISSKNEFARNNSVKNLNGSVKNKIVELRNRIIHECAYIESAIDDPEHYELDGFSDNLKSKTENIISEIEGLIKSFDTGKLLNEGIDCCIIGRPNVGKSSVFNAMTGEEKAIVTNVPGTTRDTIETMINYEGLTLKLTDTAGIRDTEDKVEIIGIDRAKDAIERSDVIFAVFDSSENITDEDREILSLCENRKAIVVLNKTDLDPNIDETEFRDFNIIRTSVKTGEGIEELFKEVSKLFFDGELSFNDEIYITSARQAELLKKAKEALLLVIESIDNSMSEEFLTSDLMEAYGKLGEIIGEEIEDDLAETIFRDFCMGK